MSRYFGTDGFRGKAGTALTARHAFRIGQFLAHQCRAAHGSASPHARVRAVIGKDTRRSGYMLEYAIAAGLTSVGADAYMLHVTTTPSVSYITAADGFDCGIMISASHNPYDDNGIKLIGAGGEKMDDAATARIEDYLDSDMALPQATGEDIGRIVDYAAGRNRYIAYLISLSTFSYKNCRIALDCANGSAWMIARSVFEALGARVHAIGITPDGLNINREVGSTHPEQLATYVREHHMDIGFAFDGDADRCIAVDEHGNILNGDHILYILADDMKRRGMLTGNTVVTTVMSNMGLYRALDEAGIDYVKTAVGDRFIYESMREHGWTLGGEQSGHIIVRKYATTGDGILTAILLMEVLLSTKQQAGRLAQAVQMYPQLTENLPVTDKNAVLSDAAVQSKLSELSDRLGENGRILLRASGTEPLVRIMAEARDREQCAACVAELADVIRQRGH